jgi:hypothetical protein
MNNFSNSSNLIETSIIREWDFWDYSLLICLVFGMIGNSLSILVMNSKELHNSNTALFVRYIFFQKLNRHVF